MDLEDKKENIQPLRGGRNIEQLEYAFLTPERWEEDRKLREEAIEKDAGDDPLAAWFDYVYWMEQTNPSSAKPAVLNDAIRRCVQTFENDARYAQDRRFIKLCIKYIDTQSAPVELYNELYNRGVGTLCSDLYIAWAYYYDAVDNFAKTEEIFQKGIAAGAEPKAELEQAHTAFGFSMSQRFLHKDEYSKLKFKTSLEDRRNALTSLKSMRKKHVGSVRTGLAVKSYQPGVVNQENVATNSICRNAPAGGAIVYTGEPDGGGSVAASIVHPFSSVHNEAENIVEAARLAKSGTHKKPVLFGKHQSPSFDIPMDEDIFEPIPSLVDNYGRGLTLSAKFHRRNLPQTPFELSVCVGDKMERAIPMYDKIRLYCRANQNEEYSPEELRAYRYFLRKAIDNKFADMMSRVWGRGAELGIRLHPLHLRNNNVPNAIATAPILNPAIEECDPNMKTRIREMYANRKEEKSIEELLVSKWTEGRINKGVDRRYHDDVCPVDMDETHVESKRISMGIARYSMAPAPVDEQQQRLRQRRSVFPTERTAAACILEETEDEISSRSVKHSNRMAAPPVEGDGPSSTPDRPASRKRVSNEKLQQEVSKKEDCKPTPAKHLIPLESQLPTGAAKEAPSSLAVPPKFNIFSEESDEEAGKPEDIGTTSKATDQPYYPNDTCSTQMFNFFVKNRSTPLGPALRMQPLTANIEGAGGTAKRMVVFEDDELLHGVAEMPKECPISPLNSAEMVPEPPNVPEIVVNDENVPPVVESSTPPSTSTPGSSTCNSTQSHKQLSTIMERTETSTHSSTAVGAVTKSSGEAQTLSPEPQVSVATSNIQSSMKPADSQTVANDGVFKVPPPSDGGIFCIHLDSTETMANIPLVVKRDLPTANESPNNPSPEAEKENQVILRSASAAAPSFAAQPLASLATTPCAGPGRLGGVFNLLDDPTFTDCQPVIVAQRNISQLAQRDMDVNSIASFRLTTERTNTVPLQLVRPLCTVPELAASTLSTHSTTTTTNTVTPSTIQKPPNSDNSFLDLLETTFSPKASAAGLGVASGKPKAQRSSFNLSDLMKTPQPKAGGARTENVVPGSVPSPGNALPCPDMRPIKVEKSLQLDASMELPKFTISVPTKEPPRMQLSPVIKIELDDFPSPLPQSDSLGASTAQGKHGSLEDLNTAVFSMNINRAAMNSTVIRESGFRTPSPKQHTFAEPVAPRPPLPLKITNVRGGVSGHASLRMPPGPHLDAELDVADAEVSIYQPRPAVSQEAESWEEVDEHSSRDSESNGYRYKAIDLDSTQMQINAYVEAQDFDPFDRQLQEAFLDQLDFMSYLATSVPTCKMVNKVQPLKKAAHVEAPDGNIFEVQRKIGQGTYGAIYCANHVATGKQFALKQERPANLWEYYICLELRSRITNCDILPGFLPIDYAIIGNNASIFIAPFSRYGNILDVCNAVHSATSRNMDEFIAMIISSQILSIVDHLHSCQIIHADIKPDNFLLMAPIDLGSAVPCVQLIDFGVSIDMKAFKNDRIKFTKVVNTEGFTCIEMLERKPWTYQPDLYGVAGTAHVMLFGKYMQVEKNIVNWNIKSAMPRYFKKAVWENFFAALLNIRDCDHLPNLQQLRTAFLEEVAQNERYIRGKVSEFNNVLASSK